MAADGALERLVRFCHERGLTAPAFEDAGGSGPEHARMFSARVAFGPTREPRQFTHTASGTSKKAARRAAAAAALASAASVVPPAAERERAPKRARSPEAVREPGPERKRGASSAAGVACIRMPAAGVCSEVRIARAAGSAGPAAHAVAVRYLRDGVDDVDGALRDLGLTACGALGFDIEARPAFERGVHYPTSVVQLSSLRACVVVSVGAGGGGLGGGAGGRGGGGGGARALSPGLARLLFDPRVLKLGCGVRADLARLAADFAPQRAAYAQTAAGGGTPDGRPAGFVELPLLARLTGSGCVPGEPDLGLRRLARALLGVDLSKAKRLVLSRWDRVPLDAEQVVYAAMDASIGAHLAAAMLGVHVTDDAHADAQLAVRAAPYADAGPSLGDLLGGGDACAAHLPSKARAMLDGEAHHSLQGMGDETVSVKVAVRCRPFNTREKERNAKLIIEMRGNTTKITNPADSKSKDFTFDYSYWSHDGFSERPEDGYLLAEPGSSYADQGTVMSDLGMGVLENAWGGYHSTVFAYGQTGSGKSYSIVGYGSNKGVIPMTCAEMFRRIDEQAGGGTQFQVEASMMEIYNEKMRDLLDPSKSDKLKIRETKQLGVYIDQLTTVAVKSYKAIERQMEVGTAHRTIGATQMNATSSRAHTVFTITFKQIRSEKGKQTETKSVINLVDLAGSERATSTGATGDRLKEGASINSSLTALGQVITALAENSTNPKKKTFVPYRNSVLTRLLQSALGGNSKTVMVAALSPADINYDETLSTLRYADNAKKIKTSAVRNEDPTDKLIRELREENDKLRRAMGGDGTALTAVGSPETSGEVAEAAKEAARLAESDAASARVAATAAKDELAAALKQLHDLEAMLAAGGADRSPLSAEAAANVARFDRQAADAQAAAQALGTADEQAAAEAESRTLTADLDAIAASGGAHGAAVADATVALALRLARADDSVDFADTRAVLAELLAELRAAGRAPPGEPAAPLVALLDGAAATLGAAAGRRGALAAAGANAAEIVALRLTFYQRVQAARREVAAARGALDEKVAAERNSLDSASAARQTAEAALAELASLKSVAEEQSVELAELKRKSADEKQQLLVDLQRKADEAKALGDKAKAVDLTRQFNRVTERLKQDDKAKALLAEQMESNERALKALEQSWDDKLKAASELEAKRQAVLDKLGLGRLGDDIDDKTPHLVNLNEDPNLTDKLLYFLKPGATSIGADPACDAVLEGPGIARSHAAFDVRHGPGGEYTVHVSPVGGAATFVNGQQISDETLLHHSDRVIFGARQVFRLVHVSDPQRKGADKGALDGVIDWELAQHELGDALGKAINVKVDEEVRREREAMESRIAKMGAALDDEKKAAQAQLDAERRAMLDSLRVEETEASRAREAALAAKEAELDAIKARAAKLEEMQAGLDAHVDAFRAELERVQAELSTLMPAVNEANVIADAMGRKLHVEPRVHIEVPETAGLSPAQELLLHKTVALQVVLTTTGSEERQKRETVWTASHFTDRMHAIREVHHAYLKHNVSPQPGTDDDPFYSPPAPLLIGRAYLALAPLTHRLRAQHWLAVLDPLGRPRGELLCALQPCLDDFVTPAPPLLDAGALVNTPLHLALRVQQARGLPDDLSRNVFCKYTLDMEERTTDVCAAKTSAPTFDFRDDLLFPLVSADMVEYFRSDFLTFEVWGEPEAVAEGLVFEPPKTDAAKAAANPFDGAELPPEVFDFFVSLDIHECSSVERSERYQAVQYDGGQNAWGIAKGVYTLKQGRARRLLFKLAQGQAQKYPVERCVRVWLSKVDDLNGNEVSSQQVPLSVLSTASLPDGSSATIVAAWFSGPAVLDELTAEGNVLSVTFTIEVELHNLELAAPVKLSKKAAIRIDDGSSSARRLVSSKAHAAPPPAKKRLSLFGRAHSRAQPQPPPPPALPGAEEMDTSLDPAKRAEMLRRQDTHHPVFMGSWERTDEAVVAQREDMLRVMKVEFDAEQGAQSVVQQLHEGLARLQQALQAEEQKQLSAFQVNLQSARRLAGAGGAAG